MAMGGGRRRSLPVLFALAVTGAVAACGTASTSPNNVEVQLERQVQGTPQFVECDRSADQPDQRYSCRVETTSDRFRYVATCPEPGKACVIRRTASQLK
jgi:hypothetical protein